MPTEETVKVTRSRSDARSSTSPAWGMTALCEGVDLSAMLSRERYGTVCMYVLRSMYVWMDGWMDVVMSYAKVPSVRLRCVCLTELCADQLDVSAGEGR